MPFRIFEFGCGAIVLFLEGLPRSRPIEECLSAGDLVAVVGSAILLRSDLPYLEFASLLPCLGAAAIILAGSKTLSSRLTTQPVALAIGAISY